MPEYHRPAPIIWERPKFQHWEPDPSPPACNYRSKSYHKGYRDRPSRMIDQSYNHNHHHQHHGQQIVPASHHHHHNHRRRHTDYSRYDSDGMLDAAMRHNDAIRMCDNYLSASTQHMHNRCSCEYRPPITHWEKNYQVS